MGDGEAAMVGSEGRDEERPVRAIITGAAGGIGLAVARRLNADSLARESRGARLTLVDIAGDGLAAAGEALGSAGAAVELVEGDLAEPATATEIVSRAVARFGGLDALVSNAGILRPGTLLDLSLEDYEQTFRVNTRATWLLARAAHPHLRDSRGSIVATTSTAAHHPVPTLGAYSASKAALLMLVRQLACDWGPDGIRVNSVSPGSTLTGIGGGRPVAAAGLTQPGGAPDRNPLGFISEPADQAAMIAFLVGPDARFVTGADFSVDGGVQTQLMVKSGHPRRPSAPSARAD
jgi:NAD(P)-dependent dehydrogenase (short-subunit alcohol dehydrogenase family)